jgi:hypothetical protein
VGKEKWVEINYWRWENRDGRAQVREERWQSRGESVRATRGGSVKR